MKNILKKLGAVLVVLILTFAMVTGMTASAEQVAYDGDVLTVGGKTFTIIENEVYSFREVLNNVTLGLDHTALEEVYFDGHQWYVTHQQNENGGPWGFEEDWYARESTWDGFKCICVSTSTKNNDSEIWKTHEMMIEWNEADEADENIYWSLQPLWSCSSNTWINFIAPYTGKIVLFEEFDNKIAACSDEAPFFSFQQDNHRPWKISVEKNDVKVWPMEDDPVVLDKNKRAIDFPSLGKIGVMPVNEGDIVSIRIDVAGEFETNVKGGEYEGVKISGSTTVTFNPCIAYTEIEGMSSEDEEDPDNFKDFYFEPTEDGDVNGLGWLLYVIIGAGVLVIAAVVLAVIIIASKKKKAKANSTEEAVENSVEETVEEATNEESNDEKIE